MRIFTYNLLIFLVLLFAFFGCEDNLFDFGSKKDENDLKLPPATQSGKNTLGCKINGKVWRPGKQFRLMSPPYRSAIEVNLNHKRNWFSLSTFRNKNKKTSDAEIWINVNDGLETSKKYSFTNTSDTTNYASVEYEACRFNTNESTNGYIEFTRIDTANYIIAGRFEFNAIAGECDKKDKIKITKGRFDIDYKEY